MTELLRKHDAEVIFQMTTARSDGAARTVLSGYRPEYGIRPDYLTCTHHEFDNDVGVSTGQSRTARVWFLTPEIYPHTLWIGRVLEVREGSRTVGQSTVTHIDNPLMLSLDEGPVDFS